MESGVAEDSTEQTWDSKRVNIGLVVHETSQPIFDFILKEEKHGVFRRHLLYTSHEDNNGVKIVFWQHYNRTNTQYLRYILELKFAPPSDQDDPSSGSVKIKSLAEGEMPREALERLKAIKISTANKAMGIIDCELRVSTADFGQSILTLVGTLEETEPLHNEDKIEASRVTNIQGLSSSSLGTRALGVFVGQRKSKKKLSNMSRSSFLQLGTNLEASVDNLYLSVKGILFEVKKNFDKPNVIDERKKRHFVETVMPNSPALFEEEGTCGQASFNFKF